MAERDPEIDVIGEVEHSMKFIIETQDGEYTEVIPYQIVNARTGDLREPDYNEELVCCFSDAS